MDTASRLSSSIEGQRLVLHYLGPRDEPWLRALLEVCSRFAGKKQLELHERLKEPLPTNAPRSKLRLAVQVLERLLPEPPKREPSPREVRFRVFHAAAQSPASRRETLTRVASDLRVEVARVEDALFADLASQRRVGALPADLSPSRLALLTNQALVWPYKDAEGCHSSRGHTLRSCVRSLARSDLRGEQGPDSHRRTPLCRRTGRRSRGVGSTFRAVRALS